MQQQQQDQPQSNEELCNLLVQSLIAKDEILLQKVLEQDNEVVIKNIISRIPVNHVKKLVIELRNILSVKLTVNLLTWLQHLLALKYSVISSMADGRSILLPLISLLDDKSAPDYYNKMLGLKGKLTLLKQLREVRRSDRAETVVRVQVEPEQPAQMEVDSETDTESEEEDFDSEQVRDEDEEDDLEAKIITNDEENVDEESGDEDDSDEDF